MKINLLKKAILLSAATYLVGCGTDTGKDPGTAGAKPLSVTPLNVSIDATHDSAASDRWFNIDLLEGVSVDPKTDITLLNMNLEITDGEISIRNGANAGNQDEPGLVRDKTLSIDRNYFANKLAGNESVTLSYSYWIDNGWEFPCENMAFHPVNCTAEEIAANTNIRTTNVTVHGSYLPRTGFTIADSSISAGKSGVAITSAIPEQAEAFANTDFTWSVTPGSGTATVDSDGVITGVTAGTATLVGVHPTFGSFQSTITILNDIFIIDSAGNTIGDSINVASCGAVELTAQATQSLIDTLPGDVSFTSTSSDLAIGETVKLASDNGNAQPHRVVVNSTNAGDTFDVTFDLADYTGSDDNVTVTVNVIEDLVCTADTDAIHYNANVDGVVGNDFATSSWTLINDVNGTAVFVDNNTNDDAAGTGAEGFGTAVSVTYNEDVATNNAIIESPIDSADGVLTNLFNDDTKTWKISFDARVAAAAATGAGYALRFEIQTGGVWDTANYQTLEGYLPENGNAWQTIEGTFTGKNFADADSVAKRVRLYVWKRNHPSFPNAAITTVEMDNISVTEVPVP